MACFFLLPDTPSLSGRWLKPEEQRFLNLIHHATRGSHIERLAEDKSTKNKFNWAVLWQVMSDKHLYLQALVCKCSDLLTNIPSLTTTLIDTSPL